MGSGCLHRLRKYIAFYFMLFQFFFPYFLHHFYNQEMNYKENTGKGNLEASISSQFKKRTA